MNREKKASVGKYASLFRKKNFDGKCGQGKNINCMKTNLLYSDIILMSILLWFFDNFMIMADGDRYAFVVVKEAIN